MLNVGDMLIGDAAPSGTRATTRRSMMWIMVALYSMTDSLVLGTGLILLGDGLELGVCLLPGVERVADPVSVGVLHEEAVLSVLVLRLGDAEWVGNLTHRLSLRTCRPGR